MSEDAKLQSAAQTALSADSAAAEAHERIWNVHNEQGNAATPAARCDQNELHLGSAERDDLARDEEVGSLDTGLLVLQHA